MSPEHPLAGARILLLEDNFVAALDVVCQLESFGAVLDGPYSSVAEARQACARTMPDVALLDVSVRDGHSIPLALELSARDVPVVFITGFGAIPGLPAELAGRPVLRKPFEPLHLEEVLRTCRAERGLA